MKTAIVILNWNGAALLHKFLPSVVEYSAEPDVSIIVADNSSTDGSLRLLEEEFPQVKVIPLKENYGFAQGYNLALKQVEADYYVLLNSDVEVSKNWLTPLTAFLSAHPEVSAVQPKILKYQEKEGEETISPPTFEYAGASGGFLDKYGYPYCRGRIFNEIEPDQGQYDDPIEVDWASGACLVVRARDYEEIGGLDARFFAHHEEIDLCWRLRLKGKHIFCLPESHVWHVGGASLPQGNPRKTYLNFRNNLVMIYKNISQERLDSVLRMRLWLDLLAAFSSLIAGHFADAKAIIKARQDFKNLQEQLYQDRNMLQDSRQLPSSAELRNLSIVWQYYVLRRRKWSSLVA